MALGTADGNFAFSPGDTDSLLAPGAAEIPMLPVFELLEKIKEFAVFLVALVGIPGQAAENGDAHKNIGQDREQKC